MVGTGITTLLKRGGVRRANRAPIVHYRNYWGRSQGKREALLASLGMADWTSGKKASAARRPEGPSPLKSSTPCGTGCPSGS